MKSIKPTRQSLVLLLAWSWGKFDPIKENKKGKSCIPIFINLKQE